MANFLFSSESLLSKISAVIFSFFFSVENGYFNFLRKVSRNCEFYNF